MNEDPRDERDQSEIVKLEYEVNYISDYLF